jgi:hypothetical protein
MNLAQALYTGTLAGKLAQLEKKNSQLARKMSRRPTTKAIEEDLGRMALLLRSVTELCLEKGVFDESELAHKLETLDLADGVEDGRLDPDVLMPGEQKLADLQPIPVVTKRSRKKKTNRRKKR